MTGLDLRPLSLGEILDRTFTLFRRYFLLFIGIAGIPQLIVFALQTVQIGLQYNFPGEFAALTWRTALMTLALLVVSTFAYLVSQAASVLAISDLYLGRPVSLGHALQRARGHLGFLFGVVVLNGLAILGGLILLIIPGIYVACRLLVCVPVALIEERSPRESLSRGWSLTKENAGRSFMILLLYLVIAIAANALLTFPFSLGVVMSAKNPSGAWIWIVLTQAGARIAAVITQPVLLIATAIF
ncbi:MAG TPA: hypothetical protein VG297_23180, partial [Bryobacteraceae bacterium]|nr:hypothetical protein [Bryobacteraceae bacterium]